MKVVKVLVAQLCLLFATPSTVAHQGPPFMVFSMDEEYWSDLQLASDKCVAILRIFKLKEKEHKPSFDK